MSQTEQPGTTMRSDQPVDATPKRSFDVVVVGAGPGGSATAAHLARRGLSVVLLEKAVFPRDKICGDGLTPRAVRALVKLGVDISEANGFHRNEGLRIYGGELSQDSGKDLFMAWPELTDFPNFGLTCARMELDEKLARHAASLGVELVEGASVTRGSANGSVISRNASRVLRSSRVLAAPR